MRGEISNNIENEKPQNFRELPNDSGRKEYLCELPDDSGDISVEKKDGRYEIVFQAGEGKIKQNDRMLEDSEFYHDMNEDNGEDAIDKKETHDAGDNYYSTYYERLKQTPKEHTERGEWDDERGESKFIPTDEKIKSTLDKFSMDGVDYEDGIPDFSECSEATVQIENMTENRFRNFKQCDINCALQWNKEGKDGRTDWTPRDVANWRDENGYTWHERNDMKTCDLIPTEINDYFGHLGGVSECRKRDAINNGGDFDE